MNFLQIQALITGIPYVAPAQDEKQEYLEEYNLCDQITKLPASLLQLVTSGTDDKLYLVTKTEGAGTNGEGKQKSTKMIR